MPYTLALFDLDGTILDTLGDLANSVNFALQKNGYPKRSQEEVRCFVGNGIRKLIERAVPAGTDEDRMDAVFHDFTAYYKEHCAVETKPYDGILPLLADLKNAGMQTAVLSNKADYAVQTLCEQYFPSLFDACAGEKEGIRRKPAPDGVSALLKQLKVEKQDAVYIGDSEVDIETAENAGMDCISVDWGFRESDVLKAAGATVIVSTPKELKSHLIKE